MSRPLNQSTRTTTAFHGLSTSWGRLAAGALMVGGIFMASTSAMNAWADAKEAPAKAGYHQAGHGHGMHKGMGMGMGGLPGGRHLDRMLDEVKATDAQRTQIRQITEAARADLRKLHEGGADLRAQSLALLSQPQIDANAAEALRQQMLARHDQMSKRSLTAMLDVAKVLTPEQRAQIAEKMKERQQKHQQRRAERAQRGSERQ